MKLSLVIPNRNDVVMLSVTVRVALEAIKGIGSDAEIVIVDNSDQDIYQLISTPKYSPLSRHYIATEQVRIIRHDKPSVFKARMIGIQEARGEYVKNMDSHELLGHNTIESMVRFLDNASDKAGFVYCPIGWCGQPEIKARHEMRTDRGNIYDGWGKKYEVPTKICWNFGSWMARKDWLLNVHKGYGFLADHYASWGGGEFYVAIKSWLLGYENWAVPCDAKYHIGPFNEEITRLTGYRYRVYGSSGSTRVGIGILASFYALAGEDGFEFAMKAEEGMKKHHGITVSKHWNEAKALAEKDWEWLKPRAKYTLKEFWEKRIWENSV